MASLLRRLLLPLFLVLSLGSGCATVYHFAEGPVAPGPAEGSARVYFALPQGYPQGVAYIVEETKLLGVLQNKMYFYVDVPAGEHQFMVIAFNGSGMDEAVRGTLDAGKTYQFKVFVTPGFPQPRIYMAPLEATGEDAQSRVEDLADSRRVEVDAEFAAKWESSFQERNLERADSFRSGEDESTPIEAKHGL